MRLTRQSEIAVAVLLACARRPEGYVQTSEAAVEAGASRLHTAKIVHVLVHAGLLTAVRGRRGGLALSLPAGCISLGAVLRHTQPEIVDTGAPVQRGRNVREPLDIVVHAARGTFVRLMERFTIADLVAERTVSRLACFDCTLLRAACPAMSNAAIESHQERPRVSC
jgi:Rrf2 family nitric oxide-sensitive transcriptional repressor